MTNAPVHVALACLGIVALLLAAASALPAHALIEQGNIEAAKRELLRTQALQAGSARARLDLQVRQGSLPLRAPGLELRENRLVARKPASARAAAVRSGAPLPARDSLMVDAPYAPIEWPIIVMLGALIPVSESIRTTGGTDLIAGWLSTAAHMLPPTGALVLREQIAHAACQVPC